MFEALKRLFTKKDPGTHGVGLCIALLREGWTCHRFPDSQIIVALPHDFVAGFDSEGVLIGTIDGHSHNFSATLHRGDHFAAQPKIAYTIVDNLAAKAGIKATDKGTYRYFKDPKTTGDESLEYTFYVIGIPRALVVVSIANAPGASRPESLERIESVIPDIIGELA